MGKCDPTVAEAKVMAGSESYFMQSAEEAYELAGAAMACNMMADDVSEGIDAFFEKREPAWKNK